MLKDPQATLDFSIDWSKWLSDGDTITTSTWTVPTGITKNSDTFDDSTTTVWLSGGTATQTYALVNRVITAGGRTDERTLKILVRDR